MSWSRFARQGSQVGKARFELLQKYQSTGKGWLIYYVFDLLYLDGHDLRGLPLLE